MGQLAPQLSAMTGQTVVDQTGLTGVYNIDLNWIPEWVDMGSGLRIDEAAGPVFEKSLGFRLEKKKLPREVLVVDHIEKMPTEN